MGQDGWEHGSLVEHLPSVHEALGLVPSEKGMLALQSVSKIVVSTGFLKMAPPWEASPSLRNGWGVG